MGFALLMEHGGRLRNVSFWIVVILALTGCTGTDGRFMIDPGSGGNTLQNAGDRVLGMDFADAAETGSVQANFSLARTAAVGALVISIPWTAVETAPMAYTDPSGMFAALNAALPLEGFFLSLTVAAVDRTGLTVPSDLAGVAFDDPAFIARYNAMLAYVHGLLPNVRILYLGLGNEVDRYTPPMASFWSEFAGLLQGVRGYIGPLEPGVKVGASATYAGLVQSRKDDLKILNQQSDIVAFTYYPVNADFTVKPARATETEVPEVFAIYPGRDVSLHETGFPSGSLNGSSEDKQSVWVRELFRVWDTKKDRWKFTNLVRLHDWDLGRAQTVAGNSPYSSNHPIIVEFLRTLGLRSYSLGGADKTALHTLRLETSSRGF